MFIAWKRRPITSGRAEGASERHDKHAVCPHRSEGERHALVPLLVRSRRVEGKPRQEHLSRFPAIRSCCIADPIARAAWWSSIERDLRSLRQMAGTDFAAEWFDEDVAALIVAGLAQKAPMPTEAERRAYERWRDEREREAEARFEGFKVAVARAMGGGSDGAAVVSWIN